MKIYIVGNKLLQQDNLPFRIMFLLKKQFKNIEFEELDPSENLPKGDLIIIDTVFGINKITIFSDLDPFQSEKVYSVHDYDLLLELTLKKKLGELKSFVIIGIPPNLSEKEAFESVKSEIEKLSRSTLLSKSELRNSYKDRML